MKFLSRTDFNRQTYLINELIVYEMPLLLKNFSVDPNEPKEK
jgi:hypothetical protein